MTFTPWSKESALAVLDTTRLEPGPVLISLQALQEEFGYVHAEAVALVAEACNVSRADVHGVLTYYHDLRRTPPPENIVRICGAEACQSVGARELIERAKKSLPSEVEVKEVFCFGNCALGPAATVNGRLVGRARMEDLLANLNASGRK
ncbi:MAG: NAD(P)H-dependent oxidoreductase subunit E [Candidatus Nanopelagicaceae bacterium]|nr:NAD(P)H-dependent oxidoreductase subunit E [Candidatus Nanopelagicaceae bacterium]